VGGVNEGEGTWETSQGDYGGVIDVRGRKKGKPVVEVEKACRGGLKRQRSHWIIRSGVVLDPLQNELCSAFMFKERRAYPQREGERWGV